MVSATYAPRWIRLGNLKPSYGKIIEKDTSFKKKKMWLLQGRAFSELLDFGRFGSWGPWIQNTLQTLGIILLKITIVVSLNALQSLKRMSAAANHKVNDLLKTGPSECNEEDKCLWKMWTWNCDLWVPYSAKNVMTCDNHGETAKTPRIWAVAGSGAKVLNFDHATRLSWESEQKWGDCGVPGWLS